MNTENVDLDYPIKRGDTEIKSIQISKPNVRALKGLSLVNVLQLDVDSLIKVLPRVTVPSLTIQEVESLDPSDLTKAGVAIVGFFAEKEA